MSYQLNNVTVGDNVTVVKKIVVGRPIRRVSGSGGSANIDSIIGVDTSGKTNGSLLVYNSSSTLWEANNNLEEQIINGGQY